MSKGTPLERLMRGQYEQGRKQGYEQGFREGRQTLKNDKYRTALANASAAYRRQNNSSAFQKGVEWERGERIESMLVPIERDGIEIFITVVKKK